MHWYMQILECISWAAIVNVLLDSWLIMHLFSKLFSLFYPKLFYDRQLFLFLSDFQCFGKSQFLNCAPVLFSKPLKI